MSPLAALRLCIAALGPVAVAAAAGTPQHVRVVLSRTQRTEEAGRWPIPAPPAPGRLTTPHPDRARGGPGGEIGLPRSGSVLIGYARCSTDKQDLAAQRHTLRQLGVNDDRVYLDHGMTGRNRRRPGLKQALAAVREGDTLAVPKLDRLARSVPDARAIGDSLSAGGVRLSIGGTVYDPNDPMRKMFFNIWPPSQSSRSTCCACAPERGWRSGAPTAGSKASSPSSAHARQRAHVLQLAPAGQHTIVELAELFSVSRATIHREIARARRNPS
jgi:Resolvase, N terminal domain